MNAEFQKAFEDMIMFGTGIIIVEEEEVKHIPFVDFNNNDESVKDKEQK